MGDFKVIQQKLEGFIKRYYGNELLKGFILFFAIGLMYFLFTLFVEYMLWLKPLARTVLFWGFVAVELILFIRFMALPLLKLFKLKKGINYEMASQIIGNHFPEVNDKLLNVLQLKEERTESELLIASIEQKSSELKPIPFQLAINFRKNVKYLKYALIPAVIFLVSWLTGKADWFESSYDRVVHYQTAYEPPAPFQFYINDDDLNAIEGKDFRLTVSTAGDITPESVQIHYNGETYFLQQAGSGHFEYVFTQLKDNLVFNLSANEVSSKPYELNVIKAPTLVNFDMVLDYPAYTNKKDETLKSTGNAVAPEGTKITWKVNTKSTQNVSIYAMDTLTFKTKEPNKFEASKQLFNDFDYTISTSNNALRDYENLSFSINVIKDNYPELNIKVEKDSIDNQTLYFYGQVSDDYGLSKLQLVYYPAGDEDSEEFQQIPISKSNFDEFVSSFPNQLSLVEGVNYDLYFQVFDNDAIHHYKSVKSPVFTYRKLTEDEEEQKQLNEQNETIKDIGKTFDKIKEQDKQLEELSKIQKEKNELNYNDKKKFEHFLKRQKEQEQLMQNFNERLRKNIENYNDENDQFKEDLNKRLQENEEQLKQDEKLLEELEKLQEKFQKEEFTEKLEELAKQSKNKVRSLAQLLELTKRYYVAKKAEKLQQELEQLSENQLKLSKESKENNTKEEQDKLNNSFNDFQKELDELQKENNKLMKPLDVPRDKLTEEEINSEQQKASEELKKSEDHQKSGNEQQSQENRQKAQQKQKQAAQKMKQMSQQMKQSMMSGTSQQLSEDATMLRQILDNLVLFSFDQEDLMNAFRKIEINSNEYSKKLRDQYSLKEHFEHIDDSLFALSLRQPMISEKINKQITEVYFNINKTLSQLSENQLYHGVSSQQYTMVATNVLADFLSNVLDNLEAQMNLAPGQGNGNQEMQLPDIIMSQEELNKQMKDGMSKGEKEGKEKEGQQQMGNSEGQNGEDTNESTNGELYEIYKRQQELRQALQDKLGKEGENGQGRDVLNKMKEVELDLINKGFTNQTMQKMTRLQYQLLKLKNATFTQGMENKRQSRTNREQFTNTITGQTPDVREYFNTTEILNRQALPLQQVYKKKVQEYFKKDNDQL